MTHIKRILPAVITIIIILLAIWITFNSCYFDYSTTNADNYSAYISDIYEANTHMPSLENLGEYSSIRLNRRPPKDIFIKTMNSATLIVSYDESTFATAVENVNKKYVFRDTTDDSIGDIDALINDISIKPVNYFQNNDSILEFVNYPKQGLMIGIDEVNYRIIYFYHWDIEIQKIEDLDKFIRKSYNLNGL